jgi:SAM-dependent MidA family methyltransferase
MCAQAKGIIDMTTADEQSPLAKEIRSRIAATGGITFADYMALCLYHPQHGYYMAPRQRIGKSGDFYTSASVHPMFGELVANQLAQMWQLLGGGAFTVAEQGPGEGHLALDILDAVQERYPDFYRQLRYRLVEVSPDGRQRQQENLAGHRAQVDWCRLDDLQGLQGCLLSNELVDAFPVHLVEKRGGELQEIFVVAGATGFSEELRPLSTPLLREHFALVGCEPAEGSRAEVNLQAASWMRQIAGLLQRGFVLTVDYGYPAAELYAPHRRGGTLMCYHRHSAGENPYQLVGEQDITAHVDFTLLERAGAQVGLEPLYFGEQYRFLMGLGFVEALMERQAREPDERRAAALRMTLKNLILPEQGMGETFKVLVQGKGVGHPQLLCARPIRDIPLPGMMGR